MPCRNASAWFDARHSWPMASWQVVQPSFARCAASGRGPPGACGEDGSIATRDAQQRRHEAGGRRRPWPRARCPWESLPGAARRWSVRRYAGSKSVSAGSALASKVTHTRPGLVNLDHVEGARGPLEPGVTRFLVERVAKQGKWLRERLLAGVVAAYGSVSRSEGPRSRGRAAGAVAWALALEEVWTACGIPRHPITRGPRGATSRRARARAGASSCSTPRMATRAGRGVTSSTERAPRGAPGERRG